MKFRFALSALVLALLAPLAARSQVSVSINIGPPPLLVYVQPPVPGEGYIWTPGYWSWSPQDRDYYWVPGTWVLAPAPGYLWTPGYWGFEGGGYLWHLGYWADHVGFYGGINYGYGYTGNGYQGGRWDHNVFNYNRAVNNVNPGVVHHIYNSRVVDNNQVRRVSFNGGPGGIAARPNAAQLQVQRAPHTEPTANQIEHERTALTTPTQRATAARGAPQVAATPRPSAFTEPGVVHSRNDAGARQPAGRDLRQTPNAPQAAAPRAPAEQRAPQQAQQQAARPERSVQARPEPAPQPQQRAQPQPQAERAQPRGQGEGRGQERQQREER